jgi:hypothetical protein
MDWLLMPSTGDLIDPWRPDCLASVPFLLFFGFGSLMKMNEEKHKNQCEIKLEKRTNRDRNQWKLLMKQKEKKNENRNLFVSAGLEWASGNEPMIN